MPRSPGKQENILAAIFLYRSHALIIHPKIYNNKVLVCQEQLESNILSASYDIETSLCIDISQNLMYLKNGSIHHTIWPRSHNPIIWLTYKCLPFSLLVEKLTILDLQSSKIETS